MCELSRWVLKMDHQRARNRISYLSIPALGVISLARKKLADQRQEQKLLINRIFG
jgi:hypothetical protein